jgi:hypothetical protein
MKYIVKNHSDRILLARLCSNATVCPSVRPSHPCEHLKDVDSRVFTRMLCGNNLTR